jgi:hypothetical protein
MRKFKVMIVYNTTFYIDNAVIEEGLDYLKKNYIPTAIAVGILKQPRLRQVLHNLTDDNTGESFAVQFHVKDMNALNEWRTQVEEELQGALIRRFGNQITGFTTLLEEIDWEK